MFFVRRPAAIGDLFKPRAPGFKYRTGSIGNLQLGINIRCIVANGLGAQ